MCLIECFLGVLFCVLTVGISPTKSMSTKNHQIMEKIILQHTYVYIYIFISYIFFSVYSSSLIYIYMYHNGFEHRCEGCDL